MRTFDSLIEGLNKEEGTRITFNIDKFKKALENPPQKLFNFQVWAYICFSSFNEVIPSLGRIARDLKLGIETVKEAITVLKDYGVLEGDPVQYVSLQEAEWRQRQIDLLKKQFKTYREVASVFLSNFMRTHTKGKLNDVETDFMITAGMVHKTFMKAHDQYGLAINTGDREAAQQSHHFIKLLTDWLAFCDPEIDLVAEGWAIKDIVTNPKLIYF